MNRLAMLTLKGLLAVNLMLVASAANAATFWLNDLTIKEVQFFYDGGYKLRVYVNEPINTGCAGDAQHMLSYPGVSVDPHLSAMKSLLQQAVASGATVNLQYQNSCNVGYGAVLQGVGIKVK